MTQGYFKVWTIDHAGNFLPPRDQHAASPNPANEKATDIYFGVLETSTPPPKNQLDLYQDIEKVLRTIRLIYLQSTEGSEERRTSQFRRYYNDLFRLAQLGLEGDNATPEIAQSALVQMTAEIIDDEATRVKNGHLKQLGAKATILAVPFTLLYLTTMLSLPTGWFIKHLTQIGIERVAFANFMMLWIGCFVGVWLSYGIRTSVFTLADLTQTDSDRLQPAIRLLFAGMLTMILGIMCSLGVIKVSLGEFSLTNISKNTMLAFLVGTLCGISELLLPSTVGKQASDFVKKTNL